MEMDKPLAFRVGYRFQWEPSQNAHVVLYPEGMVTLSETAAAILKHVDGTRTGGELLAVLKDEYPGADLEDDVVEFLDDAVNRGWLTV